MNFSRFLVPVISGLVVMACGDKGEDSGSDWTPTDDTDASVDECDPSLDADCDGTPDADDCAPEDPYSYPGASEIPYDGADNDCAGDGDLTDVDGDGFEGSSVGGDDCNDGNPDIYPVRLRFVTTALIRTARGMKTQTIATGTDTTAAEPTRRIVKMKTQRFIRTPRRFGTTESIKTARALMLQTTMPMAMVMITKITVGPIAMITTR